MRVPSRSLRGLAAGAVAIGVGLAVAPAASAADIEETVTCSSMAMIVPIQTALVQGDTFTVATSDCDYVSNSESLDIAAATNDLIAFNVVASPAPGEVLLVLKEAGQSATLTLVQPGADAPSAVDQTPAPLYQGLPLPASGSCADVKDADYAWGTGLTGGWVKAWEPWVASADGKGGWACTRTLVFTGEDWAVQA